MANIGYIQVVRHCNHFCGFCSNPATPYEHTLDSMKLLVDDFIQRKYFGIILTGGEPSLHPELPQICEYASQLGLHVRMITNGHRLADPKFARDMAAAGLKLAHVSVYSIYPDIEEKMRGKADTLSRAFAAIENCYQAGIEVNINCVINKMNADHLHHNIEYWLKNHPYINHFVWNNLDPSMGRAEVNQDQFIPRLRDFEISLNSALELLEKNGKSFRVERVPLCYMPKFAWASTETRKIIKGEERIVHFLDQKQTVRQTRWDHLYTPDCRVCSLQKICGGLFNRGGGYEVRELSPLFVDMRAIVEKVLEDEKDPSFSYTSYEDWQYDFLQRQSQIEHQPNHNDVESKDPVVISEKTGFAVGQVTDNSIKIFNAKRKLEEKKAKASGISLDL